MAQGQSPRRKSGIERLTGVTVVSDVAARRNDGQGEVCERRVAPSDRVGECRWPAESPSELADVDDVDGAVGCRPGHAENGVDGLLGQLPEQPEPLDRCCGVGRIGTDRGERGIGDVGDGVRQKGCSPTQWLDEPIARQRVPDMGDAHRDHQLALHERRTTGKGGRLRIATPVLMSSGAVLVKTR